jgi:uncharacterized DUF497 family protein
MPWIRGFIWDEENIAHISRHQVSPEEVEEALYVSRPGGRIRVLTARAMTDKEKSSYRKKRKGRK